MSADEPAPRAGGPARRGRYHHGDLPSALVAAGVGLLAETGTAGFSVAGLARRVGVSTAAPYRHFTDRTGVLVAVATRVATDLTAVLAAATAAVGPDPGARLAAVTGAYVGFVAEHRVGLDVVFARELRDRRDEELAAAGRLLVAQWFEPAREHRGGDAVAALRLVERLVALAHGYAALDTEGFLTADRVTDDPTPRRARDAAAALLAGSA